MPAAGSGSYTLNGTNDAGRFTPTTVPALPIWGFCFFKPTGTNLRHAFLCPSASSSQSNDYIFHEYDDSVDNRIEVKYKRTGQATVTLASSLAMTTGVWNAYGFQFDADGTCQIYVNESEEDLTTGAAAISIPNSRDRVGFGALVRGLAAIHATGNICRVAVGTGTGVLTQDTYDSLRTGASIPTDLAGCEFYVPLTDDLGSIPGADIALVNDGTIDNGGGLVEEGTAMAFDSGDAPDAVLNPPSSGGDDGSRSRSRTRSR